jgi:hypothetical protein
VQVVEITLTTYIVTGFAVAQFVEALASNRKVAGSIPDGVTGIFQ